ncbi:MAG: AmmeMemoRadiSam system protein B [Syntrophales bacterium]|nr:AmmeMemoRadiSam system protein B [Syntrophales bacterium]
MVINADKKSSKVIRPSAVDGRFYPGNKVTLKKTVEILLESAVKSPVKDPIAIVAPHAGYIYSGQIAADAFKQVAGKDYDTVIILGTNHTSATLKGIALYPGDGFETPLGTVWIDQELVHTLLENSPDCVMDSSAHAKEHSIEVQLPFIQVLFPNAKIVPLVIGRPSVELCSRFGTFLGELLKGKKVLIVASSDLSHYPTYDVARKVDSDVLNAIITLDPAVLDKTIREIQSRSIPGLQTTACGAAPIMVAQAAARTLGARGGYVVSYANSGDSPVGERHRVVGYGAVVFTREEKKETWKDKKEIPSNGELPLTMEDKKALLSLARNTVTQFLNFQITPLVRGFSRAANQRRGVFVTFKKHGELRGCIGHMEPDAPLAWQVGAMSMQAAFNDPRFPPISANELKDTEIEISVLTPVKPVSGPQDIVVGRDGVLIRKKGRSAVFLPQVAVEQGWSREEMLNHLAMKAGLSPHDWREGCQIFTFQAIVFSESEVREH